MKQLRVLSAVCALVALVLLATSCGSDSGSDGTVIASINGRELTRGQLDDLLPDGDNTVDTRVASTVSEWLLAQVVEFELEQRGFAPTAEERSDSIELVELRGIGRNDTEQDLLANSYALSLAAGRWSIEELETLDDPEPPMYLCSNHILLNELGEAEAALERFNAGEDFAELAIELSTGPSGPNGGDLGCVLEGQFVQPFEEAAFAAESGDVIGPVETAFGFHIIQIESVGPATEENHPTADPVEIAQLMLQARQFQEAGLIGMLEASAIDNFGDDASVDSSIGTLDSLTLQISVG